MKTPENDKWLDDELARAFGSKKSEPDFEKWRQAHRQAVEMLTSRAGRQPSADKCQHYIRDLIMKSRITKLAVAAVVIIAVLVGINQFGGSIDLTTSAFAQMSKNMQQMPWVHMTGKGYQNGIYLEIEQWVGFD